MKLLISLIFSFFAATALQAETFSGRLVEAQGYLHRKDYAKAEDLFRNYISNKDLKREATLGLASSLLGQSKGPEASALLSSYLEGNPMDVGGLLLLSDAWLAQGHPARAQKELARVKVLRPSQEGLDEKIALVKLALGQKAEAIKSLDSLRGADQLSQGAFQILARSLLDEGNAAAAEAVIQDFEKKYSSTSESFLIKARALEQQKRFSESEVAFRRAIQMGQSDAAIWIAYGDFLLSQKRFPESRKIMENAVSFDPANFEIHLKVAEACEQSEDFASATKAYSQALVLSPGNDQALYGIVRVEEKRGAMDQVGAHLQRWARAYPEKSWVVLSYARLLLAIGQPERASDALKTSLSRNPEQKEVREFLAQVKDSPLAVDSIDPEPAASPRAVANISQTYTVMEGELLGTISTKVYGTSKHWRKILDANSEKIQSADELVPGMKLKIPPLKEKGNPEKKKQTRKETKARIYVVKRREMLSSISTKVYGTAKEWRRIFEANRKKLRKPTSVFVGMKLKIPPIEVPEVVEDVASPQLAIVEESISFTSAAPAKKNNSLLVSPDSVALPAVSQPKSPSAANSEVEHAEVEIPTTLDAGFRFALSAAPLREQVKLDAGGFNSNLPAKLGFYGGVEAGYQWESLPLLVSARAEYSRTRFDGLSGVAPTTINIERKRYSLLAKMQPSFAPKVNFLIGHGWSNREVQETTPRAVVTNRNTAGIILGVSYKCEMGPRYSGDTRLELLLPYKHEETLSVTGNHKSSFAAELATGISHHWGAHSSISLSLQARLEQSAFSGTGSRGSTNGKETDWIFSLPLQVRF